MISDLRDSMKIGWKENPNLISKISICHRVKSEHFLGKPESDRIDDDVD